MHMCMADPFKSDSVFYTLQPLLLCYPNDSVAPPHLPLRAAALSKPPCQPQMFAPCSCVDHAYLHITIQWCWLSALAFWLAVLYAGIALVKCECVWLQAQVEVQLRGSQQKVNGLQSDLARAECLLDSHAVAKLKLPLFPMSPLPAPPVRHDKDKENCGRPAKSNRFQVSSAAGWLC